MNKVCPLCKGEKVIPAHNGTQGEEQQPCHICKSTGEVYEERQPDSPVIIYKYRGTFAG